MLYTKALGLSLIFYCTTALGGTEIRNDHNYHPPAVNSKVLKIQDQIVEKNELKNTQVIQDNLLTKPEINNIAYTDSDSINSIMDSVIKSHNSELNNIALLKPTNKTFYAKENEDSLNVELNSELAQNKNKTQKMYKLATYISQQYDVPMPNAEKIVYSTFAEASKKNLDPTLVLSLIHSESTFKQFSKSSAGAVGLTQIMPRVHRAKITELLSGKTDIWSITGNIKVGTQILREYVDLAGGNVKKALQMYNGSSRDSKYKYSNKILAKMTTFKTVVAGL